MSSWDSRQHGSYSRSPAGYQQQQQQHHVTVALPDSATESEEDDDEEVDWQVYSADEDEDPSLQSSEVMYMPPDDKHLSPRDDDSHLDGFSDLSTQAAENLINLGSVIYKGHSKEVPHAPASRRRFFASVACDDGAQELAELDRNPERRKQAKAKADLVDLMSLPIVSSVGVRYPWDTLEQPSMKYTFGSEPGTTTLNHWVALSGSIDAGVRIESETEPRKPSLLSILERLRSLEDGLDDTPAQQYKSLYGTSLRDPDRKTNPHYAMEMQIADLITVLSRSDWIDFSKQENQITADFFTSPDVNTHHKFYLQLLLSVELLRRFDHPDNLEGAQKLLPVLPQRIAWDLAAARRWDENMAIEKPKRGSKQSSIDFDLRSKAKQVALLGNFARTLKWPGMEAVNYALKERPNEKALEERSPASMSWYTGIILPGKTLPWLVMLALIDCDPDVKEALRGLTHLDNSSGFQYLSKTYWTWECIVGKVLGGGKGVQEIGGWIGPCPSTHDLDRIHAIKVKQLPSRQSVTDEDVEHMERRSDPKGPKARFYSWEDYRQITVDRNDAVEGITVEELRFTRVEPDGRGPDSTVPMKRKSQSRNAYKQDTYEAAITFGIDDSLRTIRLIHDVWFLSSPPCSQGPHVLCVDFPTRQIRVDSLLYYRGRVGDDIFTIESIASQSTSSSSSSLAEHSRAITIYDGNVFTVLVIEAHGEADNEVLARAWCSQVGQSAVICDLKRTCIACAVREAFAARLAVVILTDHRRG